MVARVEDRRLYLSIVSGEVLTRDDLTECAWCNGKGVWVQKWHETHDSDPFPCPDCDGVGLLEGYGIHGNNYAPRRVEPLGERS